MRFEKYRNRALLNAAREFPCQLCDARGTTVAAHSNQGIHGKGKSTKAHDCFVAYVCFDCHNAIDGQGLIAHHGARRHLLWELAHFKTVQLWLDRGMLDEGALGLLQLPHFETRQNLIYTDKAKKANNADNADNADPAP